MNFDLRRPGAPAGEDSRKLCGGEDMALRDVGRLLRSFSGHVGLRSAETSKTRGLSAEVAEGKSARLRRLTSMDGESRIGRRGRSGLEAPAALKRR